jgi:hypothetical protein
MNDRSFENRERTMGKIISLFFENLYLWTAAYVSPLTFLFALLFLVRWFILYTYCKFRAPCSFNEIGLLLVY